MAKDKRSSTRRSPRATRKPAPTTRPTVEVGEEGVRLNKYVARAGVCSRRDADDLIDKGRVKVNGHVVREYWYRVQPGDEVEVSGRVVSPRDAIYVLLNKPKDVITTTDDERGRTTVLDLVGISDDEGLFPVGRLDRDTTGVLLLTNDGDLAHRLMHPRYEVDKLYVVQTHDAVKPHQLDSLRRGVELDDGMARADRVTYLDPDDHHRIGMKLHEGRNRQIRRMLEALDHEVVHLERVRYAGLATDDLRRGAWRRLQPHEVQRLRNLVNLK